MRSGTQATASKALGIDQATVSRRLLRLEDSIGSALFLRDGTRLIPTEAAQRLAERAEEAEASLSSMVHADPDTESGGVVRIVAPSLLTAYLLAPALPLLCQLRRRGRHRTDRQAGSGRSHTPRCRHRVAHDQAKQRRLPGAAHRDGRLPGLCTARRQSRGAPLDRARRNCSESCRRRAGWRGTAPTTCWCAPPTCRRSIRRCAPGSARRCCPASWPGAMPPSWPWRHRSRPRRELWLLVERRMRQVRRVSLTLGWVEAVVRDAFPAVRGITMPQKKRTPERGPPVS